MLKNYQKRSYLSKYTCIARFYHTNPRWYLLNFTFDVWKNKLNKKNKNKLN